MRVRVAAVRSWGVVSRDCTARACAAALLALVVGLAGAGIPGQSSGAARPGAPGCLNRGTDGAAHTLAPEFMAPEFMAPGSIQQAGRDGSPHRTVPPFVCRVRPASTLVRCAVTLQRVP
ncbi:hypothetical protein GCM10008959_16270 [Deinococcus seoulensis]|uniref:Secreted protein n=1 Tax=Deinococcus seoulensis TaxID=1837379 RepID=A0ABQ2RTP9_9DEIO|nr:hypothetical protein GCM10008959_16270 [Deinococcus seoulensis]